MVLGRDDLDALTDGDDVGSLNRRTGEFQGTELARATKASSGNARAYCASAALAETRSCKRMEDPDLNTIDGLAANLWVLRQQHGHRRQRPAAYWSGLDVLHVNRPAKAETVLLGGYRTGFDSLGRRIYEFRTAPATRHQTRVGSGTVSTAQHRGVIDQARHRAARAKAFGKT